MEVAEVLEARHQRNFGDCVRGGLQQRGSTPHAKPENPLRGCLPKVGAERPAQMGFAAAGHARQLRWTLVKCCIVAAELYQGVVQSRRHCSGGNQPHRRLSEPGDGEQEQIESGLGAWLTEHLCKEACGGAVG